MTLTATLALSDAARTIWDVLVVGAGPAGSVAARELARRGARVLLVDRSAFPRDKVCGGCLSARGRASLVHIGLDNLPERLGAIALTETHLFAGGRHVALSWPGGVALSRSSLDAGLIAAAIDSGAQFLPSTLARIEPANDDLRTTMLRGGDESVTAVARIVIAADGLGSPHTPRVEALETIAAGSRLGAGCTLDDADRCIPTGSVFMACGRGGYVGQVRLEDGHINVAAALDGSAIRHHGGPGPTAVAILAEAGAPAPVGLASAQWRGTPPLTRRRPRPWAHRLFFAGDSASYYEPFTGEGMAWAMESGATLAPVALAAARRWDPQLGADWTALRRRIARTGFLRLAAFILRRPRLAGATVALLARWPRLVRPVCCSNNRLESTRI